jgi:hypothetical protein
VTLSIISVDSGPWLCGLFNLQKQGVEQRTIMFPEMLLHGGALTKGASRQYVFADRPAI